MFVVCVTAQVKPEHIEEFLRATEANHRGTRAEPGNVRFDVHQGADDPGRFFLYEVYRSEADFHAHHQTAHYLAWRDRVADWMAAPRQAAKYRSRWPVDAEF
jgi:quinol monooxygenase YgiN